MRPAFLQRLGRRIRAQVYLATLADIGLAITIGIVLGALAAAGF